MTAKVVQLEEWLTLAQLATRLGYLIDREDIDDARMAERLAGVTPESLKRRASALREGMGHGGGSDKYMAQAMAGVYRAQLKVAA